MRALPIFVFVALTTLAAPAGVARDSDNLPTPPAGYALQPVGQGSLSWFGLRVYDAALWTPDGRPDVSRPFALVVRYARALDGEAIAARSIEEIERLGAGTPAQRGEWAARLRGAIPDVEEGDQITGLYRPGQGARFYLNGRLLGEIDDPAFARAFFAIWLDPRTSAPELRAALLGAR